jgi:Rps23 Pro-64 3,4-dihydroxylase Tpa1-like proline 4-hydroxylase
MSSALENLVAFKPFSNISEKYNSSEPFPHIVINNFLNENFADILEEEFVWPGPKSYRYDNVFEKKVAQDKLELMPASFAAFLSFANTSPFVRLIESITGIKGLIPDPHFRGGGTHWIMDGGHLDVHADFSIHPELGLYRRVNLLIYLNKDWEGAFKGNLELWNKDMTKCQVSIAPHFNRAVIFNTDETSFHGHPEPLACGEDRFRKSIALYYYTVDHPNKANIKPHSTMYQKRPQDPVDEAKEALRIERNKGRLSSNV